MTIFEPQISGFGSDRSVIWAIHTAKKFYRAGLNLDDFLGTRECEQCDQIGRFFELLDNKYSYQSRPNILLRFGQFLIIQLSCKNYLATFWAISWKNWQLLIPSSGHTEYETIFKNKTCSEFPGDGRVGTTKSRWRESFGSNRSWQRWRRSSLPNSLKSGFDSLLRI